MFHSKKSRHIMKIKHIVSCFFVSLIGLSACSIEELPYNQLTEDELDGSYESLLSATRGNYAVFKQTAFHQGWHYAGELASDNVSLSGVSSDALMYIYNYQRITEDAYGYGQQRLQETLGLDDEAIYELDGYMDFEQYGQDCMENDCVTKTEFGLLRRLDPPFPEQRQGQRMM